MRLCTPPRIWSRIPFLGRTQRRSSAGPRSHQRHAFPRMAGENGVSKKTAVVIVDHGSRREEANELLRQVVDSFQTTTQIEVVEPAHLEILKPDISDALCACADKGAEHVIVSPFFLSPGRHSREDIPFLVQKAIEEHGMDISYSVADPIGLDPLIIDILQKRVTSALNGNSKIQ